MVELMNRSVMSNAIECNRVGLDVLEKSPQDVRIEAELTDSVTRVVFEVELTHVPPLSRRARAETLPFPFVCSTTSRLPARSNSIDRGLERPLTTSLQV